eukprot:TRINITY_DN9690_c0_g1_i5.p1 TRINITY_DN9690_c0_g1~~TRINITY_DN9690_c0_g1_i5.p1  ORF type:complete len:1279 (+),score=334.90 TRINITY_DN9690_c0_g1_i5:87-3923(+)
MFSTKAVASKSAKGYRENDGPARKSAFPTQEAAPAASKVAKQKQRKQKQRTTDTSISSKDISRESIPVPPPLPQVKVPAPGVQQLKAQKSKMKPVASPQKGKQKAAKVASKGADYGAAKRNSFGSLDSFDLSQGSRPGSTEPHDYNDSNSRTTEDPLTAQSSAQASTKSPSDAFEALQQGKVPYNSVNLVAVGPGGAGKTATRRSIMGMEFSPVRESTVGGEQEQLLINMTKGDMINFKKAEDVNQLERVLRHYLSTTQDAAQGKVAQLLELVQNNASADEVAMLRDQLTEAELSLLTQDASGKAADKSKSSSKTGDKQAKARDAVQRRQSRKDATADAQGAEGPTKATKQVEELHFEKEAQAILKRAGDDQGEDGIHSTFFDMGGQCQFHTVVAGFLRNNNIISVFFRMDEVLLNLRANESRYSDSYMQGVDELDVWLDAVPAATSQGPVLLVGTFADNVPDRVDRKFISDTLKERLAEREHPLLVGDASRLVQAPDGLLFFVVDNTRSDKDAGVQAYKSALQKLCEANPSVNMPVPYNLIKLQDSLHSLTQVAQADEPALFAELRKRYNDGSKPLHYVRLDDMKEVYQACLGTNETFRESEFRAYVDFLHMQGVITHSNAAALDDLVIVDPFWLLRTLTEAIRDPKLHPKPVDDKMPPAAKRLLFEEGILDIDIVGQIWPDLDERLQQQILGLMLQSGLAVTIALGSSQEDQSAGFLIPAMLPVKPKETVKVASDSCVTVYVAPYMGSKLLRESAIGIQELMQRCSLPAGLFEQLAGRLVRLSQNSSSHFTKPIVTRTYAWALLGRFDVEMELLPDMRCIQIKIHANNATGLLQQLKRILNQVIEMQFLSLKYAVLAPFGNEQFVSVDAIQAHYLNSPSRPFVVKRTKVKSKALATRFGGLLPAKNTTGFYHNFFSYRHGGKDSEMAADFFNSMSDFALGEGGDHVALFWDVKSLQQGQQFDNNFMQALSNSLVMTPLITPHALARMMEPGSHNRLDNVLLEWWLALTLYEVPGHPVTRIVPVFAGKIFEDNHGVPHIGNLFQEIDMLALPDAVNTPTQARLNRFLRDGLKLSITARDLTVRGIVSEMMKFNASGSLCWDVFGTSGHGGMRTPLGKAASAQMELRRVVSRCANYVFSVVEEAVEERKQAGKQGNIKTLRARAKQQSNQNVAAAAVVANASPANTSGTKDVENMDVKQVGDWLTDHNLGAYVEAFSEMEIQGSDLLDLTDDELKELFVGWRCRASVLAQRRLSHHIVIPCLQGMRKLQITRFRKVLT